MNVFRWTLRDERAWVILWSGAVAAVTGFVVFLYPAMGEALQNYLDKESFIRLFAGRDVAALKGKSFFDVWMCLEFFSYFAVLIGIYPLMFAAGAFSGEMERDSLELLLAQPISRRRVFLERFMAAMLNLAIILAAAYGAIAVAAHFWIAEEASLGVYIWVFLNGYLLLFAITAFGFLVSVVANEQRKALAVSIAVVLASFLLYKVLSGAGVGMGVARLTCYFYADATRVLALGGPNWLDNAVLLLAGLACLAAALALFERKDVAG